MALVKVQAGALTAQQIKTQYNNERHLFDPYSKLTVVGDEASLEIETTEVSRQAKAHKNVQFALDRSSETLHHGDDVTYNVSTNLIADTDLPDHREFYESIKGGESFTFYPGSGLVPDHAITCELDGADYAERREAMTTWHRINYRFRQSN